MNPSDQLKIDEGLTPQAGEYLLVFDPSDLDDIEVGKQVIEITEKAEKYGLSRRGTFNKIAAKGKWHQFEFGEPISTPPSPGDYFIVLTEGPSADFKGLVSEITKEKRFSLKCNPKVLSMGHQESESQDSTGN